MAHLGFPRELQLAAYHKTDGVHALYANIFLRQFAVYTFGLFVPLYLVKLSRDFYGVDFFGALIFVTLFYLAIRVVYLLLYLPLVNIIYIFGTRWSIFVSNLFFVIYLGALSVAAEQIEFLLVAVVAAAVYLPLYWTSYRYLLAADSHAEKRGREIGKIGILDRIGQIVGPLLGGMVVTEFGFRVLFGVAVLLVLVSSIPPFFMHHHRHAGVFSLARALELAGRRRNWGALASVAASAVRDISDGIFWPLFVFVLLAGYDKLGLFYSLTGLITILAIGGVGFLDDKYRKTRLLKAGTAVIALIWAGRAVVWSVTSLYLLETAKRLGNPLLWVTHDSYIYQWGRRRPLAYMIVRMLVWQAAAAAWLLLLAVGFWFGLGLRAVFAATALVIAGHLLVLKK